ncbi:MAG: hypothetical protein ACI8W8_002596 [Rhodothermales bacterium]|jgi:hypothetical protein
MNKHGSRATYVADTIHSMGEAKRQSRSLTFSLKHAQIVMQSCKNAFYWRLVGVVLAAQLPWVSESVGGAVSAATRVAGALWEFNSAQASPYSPVAAETAPPTSNPDARPKWGQYGGLRATPAFCPFVVLYCRI